MQELWSNHISSELTEVDPGTSLELLSNRCKQEGANWLVLVKQDSAANHRMIKIRSLDRRFEDDVSRGELVNLIQHDLAERSKKAVAHEHVRSSRPAVAEDDHPRRPVTVLGIEAPRKKTTRRVIIEKGEECVSAFQQKLSALPIYAVDVKPEFLSQIARLKLDDESGWRQLSNTAASSKAYIQKLHDALAEEASRDTSHCFLYGFRTETVLLYDLGHSSRQT